MDLEELKTALESAKKKLIETFNEELVAILQIGSSLYQELQEPNKINDVDILVILKSIPIDNNFYQKISGSWGNYELSKSINEKIELTFFDTETFLTNVKNREFFTMDVLNFNKVLLSNGVNLESLRRENPPDARTIDSRLKAHCKLYCKVFQIYQLSKLFNLSSTFKDEVFKPIKWLPATLLFKRSGKFDHLNSEQESLDLLPEWVKNNYEILSASYKIEKNSPQLIHILEETFHYFYKELSGKDFPKINEIESSIESDFSKPLIFLSFDKSWKFLACELSNEINKVIEIDESLNKNIILEKIESKKHLTNFLYNSWTM